MVKYCLIGDDIIVFNFLKGKFNKEVRMQFFYGIKYYLDVKAPVIRKNYESDGGDEELKECQELLIVNGKESIVCQERELLNVYHNYLDFWLKEAEIPLTLFEILEGININVSDCVLINGLVHTDVVNGYRKNPKVISNVEDIKELKKRPRYGNLGFAFETLGNDEFGYVVEIICDPARVLVYTSDMSIIGVYDIDCSVGLESSERLKLVSGNRQKIH